MQNAANLNALFSGCPFARGFFPFPLIKFIYVTPTAEANRSVESGAVEQGWLREDWWRSVIGKESELAIVSRKLDRYLQYDFLNTSAIFVSFYANNKS